MAADVSVILIRESPEQVTGSGCCGKLEGDTWVLAPRDLFPEVRRGQRELGVLYRALREFFPEDRVAVVTVDPRNQLFLVPKLWYDVFHYRPGWRPGLQTVCQWFSLPAIVINGQILPGQDGPIDPDTVCHHVTRLLAGAVGEIMPDA
jgi:hypothetical protein